MNRRKGQKQEIYLEGVADARARWGLSLARIGTRFAALIILAGARVSGARAVRKSYTHAS